jgi:hypothetical protein
MPLFNYTVLFLKEHSDDVKTFIIYNDHQYTIFGTRKRLVDNNAANPVINQEDRYCDFYTTFHETNYSGMTTFLSLAYDNFERNVEIALYSVNIYPEEIDTMTIQDMYDNMSQSEIFGYDSYKIKKNRLDDLLRILVYHEI